MTDYAFLKRGSEPDIISMEEIAGFENTENPKEGIRRMLTEAKERRKALAIDDMEQQLEATSKKQKEVQVKA